MGECTCYCNGLVRRQRTVQSGFPKKLLVATSVVVIITMCLIPAEARAIEHMKRRHERHLDLAHQKDVSPQRKQIHRLTHNTNDTTNPIMRHRNAQAERFKSASKKIIKKLKNTRRFFKEERRVLNETKEYGDGMPSWVPAMNFVDIHFFNYRSLRRHGATITEKKFMYLMPKLYKSLMEYQEIFKLLLHVEVDFPDDPFCAYNKTRHELISKTIDMLYSTIGEIKENMISVNMDIPKLTPHKKINKLEIRVNAPQCLKNDYIAFRAYGNLLNNWYSEFRCPTGKLVINKNKNCMSYEAKLKKKKDTRNANKNLR